MITKARQLFRIGTRVGLLALLIISAATLLGIRLLAGKGLGLRSLPRAAVSVMQAVAGRESVTRLNRGKFTNIILLHHSTGELLIQQGGARERFTEAGYDFWDQGYNQPGLRDPMGRNTGFSYFVRNDNTDPDGLAQIFSQRTYQLPVNTFSGLLQHEVIMIKSCFLPANNIASEQQLEDYQQWYLVIRDQMDKHPDKLFVLLTTPPVNPAETNPVAAARAMRMANWLTSDEFLRGHPNVFVFDLYTHLADMNAASPEYGMLQKDYRNGGDSHPNQMANETVGPVLVDSVIKAIESYRSIHLQ